MNYTDPMDEVYDLTDEYWLEFSSLVEKYLNKSPEGYRDILEDHLQEHSSVFGRKR